MIVKILVELIATNIYGAAHGQVTSLICKVHSTWVLQKIIRTPSMSNQY